NKGAPNSWISALRSSSPSTRSRRSSLGRRWRSEALTRYGSPSTRTFRSSGVSLCRRGAKYYDVMDPFVTLSAAAAATKRLKLVTGVCLLIQRDTIQTAKLVASLDQISSGRFIFGIGGGWNAEEMENHGTIYETRFKKMREQIEAIKAIWTTDKAEY